MYISKKWLSKGLSLMVICSIFVTVSAPLAAEASFWDYVNPFSDKNPINEILPQPLPLPLPLPFPSLNTTTNTNTTPTNVYNTSNSNNNINSTVGSNVNSNVSSPGATVNAQGNSTNSGNPAPSQVTYYPQPQPQPQPQPAPQPLSVSCYATPSSINAGNTTTWYTSVYGGTGSYSYSWSGTDGLSGGASSVSRTYYNPGTKSASVTVTSGNQTVSRSCSNSVSVTGDYYNNDNNYYDYNYYNNLSVSCYPSAYSPNVGQNVYWTANVSGGSGYYSYSWSGTDGLYSSGSVANRAYTYSGTKYASVTVSSGNQTITRNCGSITVGDTSYYNNYNYNYPYNTGGLSVSCTANLSAISPGGDITWTAYASGGSGQYYYSWSGTDNLGNYYGQNLGNSIHVFYTTTGTKYATVTVQSGGQSVSRLCSNSVNVRYPTTSTRSRVVNPASSVATKQPLDVTCVPNTGKSQIGDSVVWNAQATGGTGTYSYTWNGSDGLFGLNSTVFKSYDTAGSKLAAVTVASGKETVTRQCVNAVAVAAPVVDQTASSVLALDKIPWGLLSVLIIIVLAGALIYTMATRPPRA